MTSTLLLKLIATDDAPFSQEFQNNNNALLDFHLGNLKKGTVVFKSVQFIASALNYLSGFIRAGLVAEDIDADHLRAAHALVSMVERKRYKLTEEEAAHIELALQHWKDITAQASEKLIREIQHAAEQKSDKAIAEKTRNKSIIGRSKKKRK